MDEQPYYDATNPYATPRYTPPADGKDPAVIERETRQWAMILHLSQFAGYVLPLAGYAAPIVIWQVKKDALPAIDDHGRAVVNWILSELIYFVAFFVLVFLLVGIPLLILLAIAGVVFPIIGAVKARDGELWRYPLSFRFF
ncbi:MAG: DUF4870 domain-containing protein [Planctomycetota bacterium]